MALGSETREYIAACVRDEVERQLEKLAAEAARELTEAARDLESRRPKPVEA